MSYVEHELGTGDAACTDRFGADQINTRTGKGSDMTKDKTVVKSPIRHNLTSLLVTVGVVGSLASCIFPTICGNSGKGDGPVMTDDIDSQQGPKPAHQSPKPTAPAGARIQATNVA